MNRIVCFLAFFQKNVHFISFVTEMNSNAKIKRTRSTPPPAKRKKAKLSKKKKLKHDYNHDDSSEASSRNNDEEVKLINETSKREKNRKENLKTIQNTTRLMKVQVNHKVRQELIMHLHN